MNDILSEFVYGGIDGIITTFSIIAGSAGGNLTRKVILILGISNVLSDGYSMGVSRYLSSKTEITQGILQQKNALFSGIATFMSFVIIGLMPVIPFMFNEGRIAQNQSLITALIVFFLIGSVKGYYLNESIFKNGLETLSIGISAAAISYYIGKILNDKYNL